MSVCKFLSNFFKSFGGGEDDYLVPGPEPDHKAAYLEYKAAEDEAHRLQEEEKEELKQFARLIGRACKSKSSSAGTIINGASGLPMIGGSGGVDAAGNSFGSRHRGIGDI
ncbi:hypothetical protein RW64_16910 [Geobacter sulfurreducens]|nr:hypothetical protein RW64_16910 [Geobacter sulfurreducens]